MKKHIRPDAFIYTAVQAVNISGQEEALYQKFQEVYKDQIQQLYDHFLLTEALTRLLGLYPVLNSKISDTSLSNRAKKALQAYDVVRIMDLVQYSPEEIRSFRNMGAGTVKEIEDFVSSLGI